MRYGFINNFAQALSSELAQGATSMTLDDNGALLDNASAEMVYTLTLFDVTSGENEIVHVTAADGNDLTVERGQEGTTDRTWPTGTQVEMRLTAAVAGKAGAAVVEDQNGSVIGGSPSFPMSPPANSVIISSATHQASSWADCILITDQPVAAGIPDGTTVIGMGAKGGGGCTVVGYAAEGMGFPQSVTIGNGASAGTGIAIGGGTQAASNIVIGSDSDFSETWAYDCVAVGSNTSAGNAAEGSVILGNGAKSALPGGFVVRGLSHLRKEDPAERPWSAAADYPVVDRNAMQVIIATDPIDLADDEAVVELPMIDNTIFLIDSIDIVIVEADAADGDPEIVIGPDDQGPAAYLAATPVTKTAVGSRETHDPLVSDGVTSLRVAVDTAGTGAYKAKIVFRGYVMEV